MAIAFSISSKLTALIWNKHAASLATKSFRQLTTSCRSINQEARVQEQPFVVQPSEGEGLQHKHDRPTTNQMHLIEPSNVATVPAYRVLNPDGTLNGQIHPHLTADKIVQVYGEMLTLNIVDKIMFDSQRQGRISFYMTNFGEEAAQLGSAAALEPSDWVFAQYREAGVLLHRQMPLKLMLAQCYGNKEDLGKGRQMPIHYGNKELNFVTIGSPLTTQLPQAAGTAYALKLDPNHAGKIVMCYFGEGAGSEGDAHAAMNFASTLSCPVVFFCRNNGYAISTPASEQYVSDGLVHRGLGYGMSSIRVDGNDLFAVFEVTKRANEICRREKRPVLIEAMTYRVGHHSTSDDSSAYRDSDEVKHWDREESPIKRVYKYLVSQNLWSHERQRQFEQEARAKVLEALTYAERVKKLPIVTMFEDVYDDLPSNLKRQRDELMNHLEKYGTHYSMNDYE